MKTAESRIASAGSGVANAAKGIGLAVGTALVAAGSAAIKFGGEFETAMAGASTLIDTTSVDVEQLQGQILELSDKTGIAATDLGNSMYNALSAGVDLGKDNVTMLVMLESSAKLAKAGFTDIDTALTATAKTMNAYGIEGEAAIEKVQKVLIQTQNKGITTVGELGSVLAQVTPTAAAFGVSFEQVGASLANMTAQGTPTAQATTQLNSLIAELAKSGTTAAGKLEEAAARTKYAGMSFKDMMAAGVPLNKVLDLMGSYAAENNLSMVDMFSSIEAGKAALALSGENSATFTENLAAMATETDVVGEAFEKISDTSAEKFSKMMNQLRNAAIELFVQLQPFVSEALPMLLSLLQMILPPVMSMAEQLLPLIGELLEKLLPPIVELIEKLLPVILNLFDSLVPVLLEIADAIFPVLLEVIDALLPILTMLLELLSPLLEMFLDLLQPVLDLIKLAIVPLIEIIGQLIEFAIDPLMSCLEYLKGVFEAVFRYISDMISNKINTWINVFKGIIDFLKNVFTGNWKGAWEAVKNIFSTIAEGIKNAFKAPINFIIDCINNFIEGVNRIKIPEWVPLVGGAEFHIPTIPRLKAGIDFVPSDYYPAYLDYGERVLTQPENAVFTAIGGLEGLQAMMGAAQRQEPQHVEYYFTDDHSTKLDQTIHTHDALSPAELTREGEDFLARSKWRLP